MSRVALVRRLHYDMRADSRQPLQLKQLFGSMTTLRPEAIGDVEMCRVFDALGLDTASLENSIPLALASNALGEPTRVGNYATNVIRYPNGGIYSFNCRIGIVHTTTRNVRGLPDLSENQGAEAVLQVYCAWDANGNVSQILDQRPVSRLDRIIQYGSLDRAAWRLDRWRRSGRRRSRGSAHQPWSSGPDQRRDPVHVLATRVKAKAIDRRSWLRIVGSWRHDPAY